MKNISFQQKVLYANNSKNTKVPSDAKNSYYSLNCQTSTSHFTEGQNTEDPVIYMNYM